VGVAWLMTIFVCRHGGTVIYDAHSSENPSGISVGLTISKRRSAYGGSPPSSRSSCLFLQC
jgi:hypothetical protein